MKYRNSLLILTLIALSFGISIFAGCDPFKLTGTRTGNVPPVVEWAQIPQDSTMHSSNPTLKWIGKDSDGQISALNFQFTVVLATDADSYGGAEAMSQNFPAEIEWVSLGNVTQSVIPLYASRDTSVFVQQFVFLRCIDDQGAFSNVIYLFLSRNNHPPTCTISVPAGPQWCIPDTNSYWHGIHVSWEGKDSLDYPGLQPDFLWETRVYGPFIDSVSADTLSQNLLLVLVNTETGDPITTLESWTFTDLETGWYIVYTRNFDDAFVPAIPALGYLNIYEPKWIRHPADTKDILIVNHSVYVPVPGDLGTEYRDSVRVFYENLLADAGIPDQQWDWTDNINPPRSMLYNYRMVIVDDIDWNAPITDPPEQIYANYLSVGGKIWVIGRFSFANIANQEGRVDYPSSGGHPLALNYMDLSAAIFPPANFNMAEFVGATAISGTGLPSLQVDTLKVQSLRDGRYSQALPRVEYLIRLSNSEALYTFAAINPDSSGTFNGFPVGIRRENSVFKAAYFSFPLYFIKYSQASAAASEMLDWFLQ